MNRNVLLFIDGVCWFLVFDAFMYITHELINRGWLVGHDWRADALVLGWFVFGGLSATFGSRMLHYKKK